MFIIKKWYLLLFLSIVLCKINTYGQQPTIKVDFNMAGRKPAEVNAYGYTPWEVKGKGLDTLSENGVSFIIRAGNSASLSPTWYKAAVRGPEKARLTGDGITVADVDNNEVQKGSHPEEIILQIIGLSPGKHTLMTYHNIIDAVRPSDACPLDIYVNGVKVVAGLVPSVRALSLANCAFAALNIAANAKQTIIIRFVAHPKSGHAYHKIFINGFQLDGIDPNQLAYQPMPANREEHIDLNQGGSYTLRWRASSNVVAHDVYFGADSAQVATADHDAACFKGSHRPSDTTFVATGLNTLATYYWRVDEVKKDRVYKGNVWEFRGRQLAFADAEGYGRFARGGRGGKVVYVTNLNDDGPGSLRAAVTRDIGPRVIEFKVGGVIQLKSRLVLSQPYVTVAGQTAPGKGICIRSAPFGITGNDCIARFLRVRVGDGPTYDGMGLTGANNSIIDHCSISWTKDESFSSRGAHNITLQRTLISEALNAAGHKNYPKGKEHGFAATIGGDIGSFHHNLLADCYGRNWSLGGGLVDGHYGGRMDITNNVVYNWGHRATDGGAYEVNFVNNYYKPGPGTDWFFAYNAQHEGVGRGTQRCYFNGNVMPGHFDQKNQPVGRKVSHSHGDTSSYATYVDQPFFPSYVKTESANDAYKIVLSDVGCNAPELDNHDQRIIQETLAGKTSVVGSVTHKKGFPDNVADAGGYENYPTVYRGDDWDTDQDGMPDWWELSHGLNPHGAKGDMEEASADPDKDGYTQLEDYLHWMTHAHYGTAFNQPITIDLKSLARGFVDAPKFTITAVKGGQVRLTGNGQAVFTPNQMAEDKNIKDHKVQTGGFSFTVVDKEGSRMTRQVNVVAGVAIN